MTRSRRAGLSREEVSQQPLYARLLGLQYLAPSGFLCFVFLEGAVALGILLALAELVSWWGVLVLPLTVATMVKLNDIVAGALTRPAVPTPPTASLTSSPHRSATPATARNPHARESHPREPKISTPESSAPPLSAPGVRSTNAGPAGFRDPATRTTYPSAAVTSVIDLSATAITDTTPAEETVRLSATALSRTTTPPTQEDGPTARLHPRSDEPPATTELTANYGSSSSTELTANYGSSSGLELAAGYGSSSSAERARRNGPGSETERAAGQEQSEASTDAETTPPRSWGWGSPAREASQDAPARGWSKQGRSARRAAKRGSSATRSTEPTQRKVPPLGPEPTLTTLPRQLTSARTNHSDDEEKWTPGPASPLGPGSSIDAGGPIATGWPSAPSPSDSPKPAGFSSSSGPSSSAGTSAASQASGGSYANGSPGSQAEPQPGEGTNASGHRDSPSAGSGKSGPSGAGEDSSTWSPEAVTINGTTPARQWADQLDDHQRARQSAARRYE